MIPQALTTTPSAVAEPTASFNDLEAEALPIFPVLSGGGFDKGPAGRVRGEPPFHHTESYPLAARTVAPLLC
jgi:hypothetical protein